MLLYSLSAYAEEMSILTAEQRFGLIAPTGLAAGYHSLVLQPHETVCAVHWQPLPLNSTPGTLRTAIPTCGPMCVVLTTQRVLLLSPALTVLTAVPCLLPQPTPRPLSVAELMLSSSELAKRGPLFRVPVTSVCWAGSTVLLGTAGGALLYLTAGGRVGRLASLDREVWNPVIVAGMPDRLVVASSHWQTGRSQVS